MRDGEISRVEIMLMALLLVQQAAPRSYCMQRSSLLPASEAAAALRRMSEDSPTILELMSVASCNGR